ncbi:RpnC/YadD family protein [Hyalangium gracile]|uniref:hypothetical protein n=1 Tax=Hyalangium gracile TaxID=394092 RepID=UPI001CC904D9|nr:hypothetical protein [Hyalangium gracile]
MGSGTYQYQSEFARKYVAQGLQEGLLKGREEGRHEGEQVALLEVLDARGIEVDDASRAQILACTEQEQLKLWLRKAVTAESVQDLFTNEPPARPVARKAAGPSRSTKASRSRAKR